MPACAFVIEQVAIPAERGVVETHVTPVQLTMPPGVPLPPLTVAVYTSVPPVTTEAELSVTVVVEGAGPGETGPSEPFEPLTFPSASLKVAVARYEVPPWALLIEHVATPALSGVVELQLTPLQLMDPAGAPIELLTEAVKTSVPPVAIEAALSETVVLEGAGAGDTGPSEPLESLKRVSVSVKLAVAE